MIRRQILGRGNRRDGRSLSAPFNGNFANLFPAAYQVLQTDRGLTYGGTMLASGTLPPVVNLSGSTLATPKPIRVTTTAGVIGVATYALSLDGGATTAQSGTTAASIPITGLPGLSVTMSIGTFVGDEVYLATCAALADQTANGKNATQATAAAQPVLTVGYNGKPGLLFDGINDFLTSTAQSLITALPYQIVIVGRLLIPGTANQSLCGTDAFSSAIYTAAANDLRQHNGSAANSIAWSSTALARFSATYTNSSADRLNVGALTTTGANSGATLPSTTTRYELARWNALNFFGNIELLAALLMPPASLAAFDVALNSPQGYGPGIVAI